MTKSRRMGPEDSQQRAILMDAAEAILCEEGYVGISARNVATRAGLTKQLLYYYFRTMDDLILALVQRINKRRLALFQETRESAAPSRMLWPRSLNASDAALATELVAIANHREVVRREVISSAAAFRALQIDALSKALNVRDSGDNAVAGLVMIASALARTIPSEASMGLTDGHTAAVQIVEKLLLELCAPVDGCRPDQESAS
jgi:TetR/AcrR family transcriptional regulator